MLLLHIDMLPPTNVKCIVYCCQSCTIAYHTIVCFIVFEQVQRLELSTTAPLLVSLTRHHNCTLWHVSTSCLNHRVFNNNTTYPISMPPYYHDYYRVPADCQCLLHDVQCLCKGHFAANISFLNVYLYVCQYIQYQMRIFYTIQQWRV